MAPKRPAEEKELESADVTPNRQYDSSDEEVDSEEEESSDEEDEEATPEKPQAAKPISSKPMNEAPATTTKTKKATNTSTPAAALAPVASNSATATATIPSAKSPSKRALEVKETKERKKRKGDASGEDGEEETEKAKKSASAAGEDERRNMFQRLYSLDDEIVILKGMVSLRKKGKNPTSHVDELLENIKGSLSCEVNKAKLANKIATVKKKYVKNLKKGDNLSFSKPHEEKVYQLSNKVWGNAGKGNDSIMAEPKKSGKCTINSSNGLASPRKKVLSLNEISQNVEPKGGDAEGEDLSMYPCLNSVAKDGGKDYRDMGTAVKDLLSKPRLCLVSSSKKNLLEEKWKKMQEEEAEMFFRKMELIRETTNEVRATINSQYA